MEKIINYVGLEVSASIKARETPTGKPPLHKDEYILGRKYVWNYRAELGMLSYFQESTQPEISMAVHQCEHFAIIRVLCKNSPSDKSQSTLRVHLHM